MLAARVSLVMNSPSGPQVLGQGLVRAIWTDDEALSTKINQRIAHYTGQAELAEAIQDGLEARKQGDEETATAKLGKAAALAHGSGNEDTARLLAKVVDVVDEKTGTVRLKKTVDDADEMALDTRSTKTVRVRGRAGAASRRRPDQPRRMDGHHHRALLIAVTGTPASSPPLAPSAT